MIITHNLNLRSLLDMPSVFDIRNTQVSVQDRIDGGSGRQRPLLEWICDLLEGHISVHQLPRVRFARHPQNGRLYSIDNRRLLTFKALFCREPGLVLREHPWTHEFDCKLGGDGGGRWRTSDKAVADLRWFILLKLNQRFSQRSGGKHRLAIPLAMLPPESFGSISERLAYLHEDMELINVTESRCGSLKGTFLGLDIYINKERQVQKAFDFFGEFALSIRLYDETGSIGDLVEDLREQIFREIAKHL